MLTEVSAKKQPPRYKRKLDDYQELLLTGLILEQPFWNVTPPSWCNGSWGFQCNHLLNFKEARSYKEKDQIGCTAKVYWITGKIQSSEEFLVSGVWVDEAGCGKKSAIHKAGYAQEGVTPEYHQKLVKGKRLSSVAAIPVDGVVAVDFTRLNECRVLWVC